MRRYLETCSFLFLAFQSGDALPANAIQAGWRADVIVTLPSPRINLRDKNNHVAAIVDKSTVMTLIDTLSKIQNAAGTNSEFWIVKLNDAKPNAFASSKDGKNFVMISTSMLDVLGNDMDSYAALFGHEIAHNVKQHGAEAAARKGFLQGLSFIGSIFIGAKTGMNVGGLTGLGADLIDRTFSRDQEREADQLGLSYMVPVRLGRDLQIRRGLFQTQLGAPIAWRLAWYRMYGFADDNRYDERWLAMCREAFAGLKPFQHLQCARSVLGMASRLLLTKLTS